MSVRIPRRWAAVACIAITSIGLAACSTGGTSADADTLAEMEPITLTFSDLSAPTSEIGQSVQEWQKRVTEKSDGKITFENYFSNALFPANEALGQVGSGVADIGYYTVGYSPQEMSVANWIPGGATALASKSYPGGLLQGTGGTVQEIYSNDKVLAQFEEHNIHPLWIKSSLAFDMLCADPITSVDSLAGRTVRTSGGVNQGEVEALGMTNVFLPTGDVYEAFQRGVIDCTVITPTFYVPAGLWEVAKYYLPAGFSPTGGAGYIMNKDTWEGLPQVAQQIIFDEIPAWLARDAQGLMRNVQIWGTDGPDKHGVEFVDPTPYSPIITEQQDKVINGLLDNPPAGVADPEASLAKYKEILASWRQTLEGLGYNMSNNPTAEEIKQAYVAGPDSVDWDAYTAALTKALAPFRP